MHFLRTDSYFFCIPCQQTKGCKKMQNEKQSKKVYYRQTNEWIEVSDEFYKIHVKQRDKHRDKMRDRNECVCPKDKRWLCDTDCLTCEFNNKGVLLYLDAYVNETKSSYSDLFSFEGDNTEKIIMDKLLLEQLLKLLETLDEESYKICELIMQGYSERSMANLLGIPKTTFQRRVKALKKDLFEKLKDFY